MCDVTNHKSYGLVQTAFNKFRKHIFYILEDIFFPITDGFTILRLGAISLSIVSVTLGVSLLSGADKFRIRRGRCWACRTAAM